jgi:hypothetical protein
MRRPLEPPSRLDLVAAMDAMDACGGCAAIPLRRATDEVRALDSMVGEATCFILSQFLPCPGAEAALRVS